MPVTYYTNNSTDWNSGLNWTLGVKPVNNDIVYFLEGNKWLDTNPNQAAVTGLKIKVGPNFAGGVFTPANPLLVGNGSTLEYTGTLCRGFAFKPGATCASVTCLDTIAFPNALWLSGTITALYVRRARAITLGAALVLAAARFAARSLQEIVCYIDAGVITLTLMEAKGGKYVGLCTIGTLKMLDAEMNFAGDAKNVTTLLDMAGSSVFWWNAEGGAIGDAKVRGGHFHGEQNSSIRTLTNGEVWTGAEMNLSTGVDSIVTTNPVKIFGGLLHLDASGTRQDIMSAPAA